MEWKAICFVKYNSSNPSDIRLPRFGQHGPPLRNNSECLSASWASNGAFMPNFIGASWRTERRSNALHSPHRNATLESPVSRVFKWDTLLCMFFSSSRWTVHRKSRRVSKMKIVFQQHRLRTNDEFAHGDPRFV